jgi:two-component sensor histidine kinase/integral membrane sensor domain MASE1
LGNPSQEVDQRNESRLLWTGAFGLAIAVALAYFLATQLSLALLAKSDSITLFWFPAGLSAGLLIALSHGGMRLPVAAGTMVATFAAHLMGGRNVYAAVTFALCNSGEPVLAAWLIERYFGSGFSLDRITHVMGLLAAAIGASAVAAIGGAVGYKLFLASTHSMWTIWSHWVACDSGGIITVAPLVIGFVAALRAPPRRNEIIEGVMALAALAVVMTVFIISLPQTPWEMVSPVALLFPILWLAARCQPVFAAGAAFIVSLAIVWTMTFGIGHFGDPALPVADRILGTQATILGIAICAYILAALFSERRHAEAHRDLLIAELDHRVKNVLARVAAVVQHTRHHGATEEFVKSLNGRIRSIADAHSLLSASGWDTVGLADLVRRQLAPYAANANTSMSGPDVMLAAKEIQALAMVFHELVTNAAKYGALSGPEGSISVSWDCTGAGAAKVLRILWREFGGPSIVGPVQSNYGSSLICSLIPHELGGAVELKFPSDGTCCKIEIPLKRCQARRIRVPAGRGGRWPM